VDVSKGGEQEGEGIADLMGRIIWRYNDTGRTGKKREKGCAVGDGDI